MRCCIGMLRVQKYIEGLGQKGPRGLCRPPSPPLVGNDAVAPGQVVETEVVAISSRAVSQSGDVRRRLLHLATILRDGSPHGAPVWVGGFRKIPQRIPAGLTPLSMTKLEAIS
jgi:hypothetical protein